MAAAAAAPGGGKSARIHNPVHNDAICVFGSHGARVAMGTAWCVCVCVRLGVFVCRRQTIRYELNTAKNWETHWGFMRDTMLTDAEAGEAAAGGVRLPPLGDARASVGAHHRGKRESAAAARAAAAAASADAAMAAAARQVKDPKASGLPSKIPPGLMDATSPIVGDWLCSYNIPRIIHYRFPSEKYTMPPTTATDIGWPWEHVQEKMRAGEACEAGGGGVCGVGRPGALARQDAAKATVTNQLAAVTGSDSPASAAAVAAAVLAGNAQRFESFEDMQESKRKRAQHEADKKMLARLEKEFGPLGADISHRRTQVPTPYTLERFGKHARGRGDVLKWFGAREALP
nr:hypothetical protein HK105_000287 [Polyrhizophydium stewartii]